MKHLKQYESDDTINKYIIWFWKDHQGVDDYEIIEVTEHHNDIYWSKTIYTYRSENNTIEFVNNKKSESWSAKNSKEFIILSSDNIDDCLKELNIIITTNNYNL